MAIARSSLRFPAAYIFNEPFTLEAETLFDIGGEELSEKCQNNTEALIDGDQFAALLDALAAYIKQGGATAQASILEYFPLTIHGYVGLAAMTAPTLHQAIDIGVRYFHHVMPAFQTSHIIDGETCQFIADPISDFGPNNGLLAEITLCAANSLQPFLDLGYDDLVVTFQHDTLQITDFETFYPGVTVKLGCPQNKLIFPKNALEMPLSTGNKTTFRMMQRELSQREQRLANRQTLVYRVFMMINEKLETGSQVDAQSIAEALKISLRTFNRRLNDEGASFKTVHDQCRLNLAQRLLCQTNKPMVKISEELGFANESSFSRYIKIKTGLSPLQYRKSM